ncbi:MAG: dihydrolipoamide dehydrogenase [Gammaproteobacteria bacterium]|nr:MAG: dihydrolipoamide dehydrogenase [Gammaproteobacteria bacterium]UTW42141.1 FAD-dependent oxidoreductase [bacterium SCSIO 12844]
MPTKKVDLCIIGAGAGGLSVAAVASQLGVNTVLIENHKMGGDCLNYGCVPSKALLAAAKKVYSMKHATKLGVHTTGIEVNWQEVKAHIKATIKTIEPHDSKERFEGLGVDVIFGNPTFIDDKTVTVNQDEIKTKYFVIATGSSASIAPIEGIDTVDYLINETIFDIDHLPEHLITIGAGPIGCELSQAFKLLGSEVTLIDMGLLLPKDDHELTDIIRQQLISDGIRLYEKTNIISVKEDDNKEIIVTIDKDNQKKEIKGSHLLMATGRKANVEKLKLEQANIEYSKKGIPVDKRLRTNKKHIYAIGDVTGGLQFTHMAGFHAGIVIQNMLFKLPKKHLTNATPWVTYTEPELAHVGPLFSELQKQNPDINIMSLSLSNNDRAQAEKETNGKIKVAVDKKGHILAASIVSPCAGEMIYPWIMAVNENMKLSRITSIIAPYPSWGDISKRIAGNYYTPLLFSNKMKKLVRFLLKF